MAVLVDRLELRVEALDQLVKWRLLRAALNEKTITTAMGVERNPYNTPAVSHSGRRVRFIRG